MLHSRRVAPPLAGGTPRVYHVTPVIVNVHNFLIVLWYGRCMKNINELVADMIEKKEAAELARLAVIEAMKRDGVALLEYQEGRYVRLIEQRTKDVVTFPRVVSKADIEAKSFSGAGRGVEV